jgi:hypothetical protein
MATSPNQPSDPRNTTIASGKRDILITADNVQPPTPLYIQPEDSFLLTINAPLIVLPPTVFLYLRWLRPDGEIVGLKKNPGIPSPISLFSFTIGEGILLSATLVGLPNNIPGPGALFATLTVQRDAPESNQNHMVLFSDYLTNYHYPSWPYGRQINSLDGAGRIRSIVGTTPAAGVDISETVPFGTRWRLIAFRASLTTNATAINRQAVLTFDDGANVFAQALSGANIQAANNTSSWIFFDTAAVFTTSGFFSAPIPANLFLLANSRIRTVTANLQGTDQWSAPNYLVQEWVEI